MRVWIYLIFVFSLCISTAYADDYKVKIKYIKPFDVVNVPDNIADTMEDVQQLYKDAMFVNGHGGKTFKLERFDNGNIKVKVQKVNEKAVHFTTGTWQKLLIAAPEIDNDLPNLHVIIIGGIKAFAKDAIPDGLPCFGSSVFAKDCNQDYGGVVIIAEHADLDFKWMIAHSLGHAFGLYHNINHPDTTLMGETDAEAFVITDYEAKWLDKHHYFNDNNVFSCPPELIKEPITVIDKDTFSFNGVISDEDGVYMIKLFRLSDVGVVGVSFLDGISVKFGIKVNVNLLLDDMDIENRGVMGVEMMDIHGNFSESFHQYILPPVPDRFYDEEPKSVENKGKLPIKWAELKKR